MLQKPGRSAPTSSLEFMQRLAALVPRLGCTFGRLLEGAQLSRSGARTGSAVPVRDHRMQPFGSEFFAIVGRHARTTALALANFLRGVGEGQVPR